ncbi:LysR family transcriptional regulator [Luteolibacter sp. AS25]|uniref:LysR family transcriptional regulator n=1 Tax=Luteolibacter sp. AS25 TaxID=3135776 RepID=UPI00398B845D
MRSIIRTGNFSNHPADGEMIRGDEFLDALSIRHFNVFRTAFIEKDISAAATEMFTDRRAVLKIIQVIEKAANDQLFIHKSDGTISPTAFGERLFNDTNRLERHVRALSATAQRIRERGRVLRLATSPSIFRTQAFRSIFASLGKKKEFRLSFVPVAPEAAGSALSQGRCDLYIGHEKLEGDRFAAEHISTLQIREYCRGETPEGGVRPRYSVVRPETIAKPKPSKRRVVNSADYLALDETEWVRWLDHPQLCDEGTRVLAPQVETDPRFWTALDEQDGKTTGLELHACRMRQHPYEFLPALCNSLGRLFDSQ